MKKVKCLVMSCVLGISLLISNNVFAKSDGILTKDTAGGYFQYDLRALISDTIENALGKCSPLFDDYYTKTVLAFHDDKTGYVDVTLVNASAIKAALNNTQFDLNTYTESATGTAIINPTGPIILKDLREKKPNIYLYPEKTEELSVNVTPKGEITKSIPEYNEGWKVTVDPSGKIDNTYDFLFYEASVNYQFTLNKGWIVNKDNFNEEMNNILTSIGLNSKEKADFIEYWSKELNWQSSRYAAYYLDPKEINEAIKLNISKEPDSILRVHFYFVPINDNENLEIKKPEIKEFKRNGFTVVEWGGIGK